MANSFHKMIILSSILIIIIYVFLISWQNNSKDRVRKCYTYRQVLMESKVRIYCGGSNAFSFSKEFYSGWVYNIYKFKHLKRKNLIDFP